MPQYCEYHKCYVNHCYGLQHPCWVADHSDGPSDYEQAAKKVTKQFAKGQISANDLAAKMCELFIRYEGE